MSHFKRICIVLFTVLFGVAFSCSAQKKYEYKKRTPEEKARYFTKKMVDSLDVTEDEENLLYIMNIELSEKFDSLKLSISDNQLTKKERSLGYRSIYAYRDNCMRQILPRKEFLKYLDIERERWERKKAQQKLKIKKEE